MFSGLKRAFGVITLKIKDDIVHIEGIPADVIRKDISKIWSNRVTNNLFESMDDNSISFKSYFCVEIAYCIDEILKNKEAGASVRSLTKIKEKLWNETWLKDTATTFPTRMDMGKLEELIYPPMEHQIPFFPHYDQITQQYGLNGMLLAALPGLGKTYSSLATLLCLKKKSVICVVPSNSLNEVWVKTVSTFFKKPKKYWHCKMSTPIPKGMDYYIVTYEYLQNLVGQLDKIDLDNIGIILDESHRFNTADTLRTLAFVELCKITKSTDVLWLSGTPIKAISTEAIPLFRSLDPRFDEEVEARFKKIYGVSSARATDMMAHRLGITLYRATKKEEVVPPPITITIPVKIPNGEEYTLSALSKKMVTYTREREAYYATRRKADNEYYYGILDTYEKTLRSKEEKEGYVQFRKDVAFIIRMGGDARWAADSMKAANKYEKMKIIPTLSKEDKEKFKDTKSIVKYVKLKILGECLGNVVSRVRIDCNIDICKHIDFKALLESTPKKTLVFTSYVGVINALQEKLPQDGFDARFVYAKTNSTLTSIIKEFDTKEEVNPLVATFDSLSTAVPILSASCVLMCNQPWRSYIKDQAVARANRIGQDTQVTVYVIVLDTGTEPNVSSRALDVVRWSQEQCEAITGIKSPVAASDGLEGVSTAFEDYESNYNLALEELTDDYVPVCIGENLPSFMNW